MKSIQDWTEQIAVKAQEAIGYTFRDQALLKQCFTHKSYTNYCGEPDNERLEFLGDAVLQFIVSEALFLREETDEGRMTELRKRFVSREALSAAAEGAGILAFLRYAGGEDTLSGKTPSNLFEAVIAGIYLDGGMNAARGFLKRFLKEIGTVNYKSMLQEFVQERTQGLPVYRSGQTEEGYRCTVSALGKEAEGFGKSKKLSETDAAEKLFKLLKRGSNEL